MKSGMGFYDWSGDKDKQLERRTSLERIRLMKHDMEMGLIWIQASSPDVMAQ